MNIKCGNCKGRHSSVQMVQMCYRTGGKPALVNAPIHHPSQPGFIPMGKNPEPPHKASPLPDVIAGRYAVEMDDTLKFYKVDKPTKGRWSGYTFVKVYASDETFPVRGMAASRVLNKILEDGCEAAMLRYGREIGACGHCGRTLTDEVSRARGIGPVCADKIGY